MQGGGGNWAISLEKHDEQRGTEPKEQYMVACVCSFTFDMFSTKIASCRQGQRVNYSSNGDV